MNAMTDTPHAGTKVASSAAAAPSPLLTGARAALKPLASLQVTVVLFALSLVLVFFGTIAQIDSGIWQVVDQYFWSYVVQIKLNLISQFAKVFLPNLQIGYLEGSLPFPGGKTLGALMLINLLAAHILRFKLTWKRSGIIMIHSGIALMLLGEWVTREKAIEQQMVIETGDGANYTVDTRKAELALVDITKPDDETATVVPQSFLKAGETIKNDQLLVDVEVLASHANAEIKRRTPTDEAFPDARGIAREGKIVPRDRVSGVDPNQKVDSPAAYVRLISKNDGKSLGTYLVSPRFKPEPFELDGRKYEVSLRQKRYYKPFTVFLTKFRFDRYLGTETAKNYSSDVVLIDPAQGSERAAHISMNDPLRYGGDAFYQSSFDSAETTTILQVVKNPGWLIPYISCVIVGLGMLVHFAITLPKKAASVMRAETTTVRTKADRYAPWACLGFVAIVLVGAVAPLFVRPKPSAFDLTEFARLPVVDGGRLKPIDTYARTNLRIIAARESLEDENEKKVQATAWYLEAISRREPTFTLQTVRIDNEQLQNELKLKVREGFRYTIEELKPSISLIASRATAAQEKKSADKQVSQTEQKFIELAERLQQYMKVQSQTNPLVLPPTDGDGKWRSYRTAYEAAMQAAEDAVWSKLGVPPQDIANWPPDKRATLENLLRDEMQSRLDADAGLKAWWEIVAAYRSQNSDEFNAAVARARELAEPSLTSWDRRRIDVEATYNRIAPFFWTTGLYVFALVLSILAILGAGWARKSAFRVLAVVFAFHALAIIARIFIQGRPPVTNLYSSAVFIGWGCVGLGLLFERAFKGGYSLFAGSVLGFLTCLVAHNLELMEKKDQMEMMQAVLDTNFWLATHVVCITLGYVATAFAGILGILYVVQAVFFPNFVGEREKTLSTLTYVVLCLATLLSFVGTVLGGIWADQSWGRFWGWDPKENGAILIVLWNALVLHARWAGLVKSRGVAELTILGIVVVMWSWFGTNQLGKGLHAYGFNSDLATWCTIVWGVSLAFAVVGLVPRQLWASTKTATA